MIRRKLTNNNLKKSIPNFLILGLHTKLKFIIMYLKIKDSFEAVNSNVTFVGRLIKTIAFSLSKMKVFLLAE
jgi:hypothetical protein